MKQITVSILAFLFIICMATPFLADDQQFFSYYVTPDVWIILDTSGSMEWDMQGCATYGDGDAVSDYSGRDTDGDGLPNDSRMYLAKQALYELVSDPEIDIRWGLATFYQAQYSAASDAHYRVPNSGFSYPHWTECNPYWSSYYRPQIWWHTATKTYAYEAFSMHVEMAEGAPSHIAEILRYVDCNSADAGKKELRAQGGTPIPGALRGVRYEYQSKIPSDNAKWCRGYYVLLLTDGEPTYGIGSGGTWIGGGNYVDPLYQKQCKQEAESLMNTYIAPHGGDPDTVLPIKTYVVGVGLEGSETLDSMAYYGGTEHYYPATNPEELQEILRAIVSDIINQSTSYSGGEVTSIEEEFINTNYEARMYLCSFKPSWASLWEGHLKAVKLTEGTFHIDSIPDSLVYWDAGEILDSKDAYSRNIYTEMGYSMTPFDFSIDPSYLDVATTGARDSIVKMVYAGSQTDSTGHLGDIFHSTPLRIHGPRYFYEDDDFYLFRDSMNTNRDAAIYAGANDGMLHCFDDSTGEELWAFIPNDQLPNLKNLLIEHTFYEDANSMAADVWFPTSVSDSFKNADEWKTILTIGQNRGGRNYCALEVTDPYNPHFAYRFDTTLADLGQTFSDAVTYKVHKDSFDAKDERFLTFIGGGYWPDTLYDPFDPTTAAPHGNGFYALDVYNMTGNASPILRKDYWKIPPSTQYADSMFWPFPSQASVVDTNLDTYADILYIGDWGGQLWKLNVNGQDSSAIIIDDWEADIMFKSPRPEMLSKEWLWQPIFYPATTAWDGIRWWVYFGTGDRARAEKEGTRNRFYAVIDSNYTTPVTEADLKRISVDGPLTEAEIQNGNYLGWYINFEDFDNTDTIGKREGEKVVSHAIVLMDTVIFTTFQPYDNNDPCASASGVARFYKIHYKTGDFTNNGEIIGSGLPQAARYSFNISGEGYQIISLPGQVIVKEAQSLGIRRKLLWWHESK